MNSSNDKRARLNENFKKAASRLTENKNIALLVFFGFAGILLIFLSEVLTNEKEVSGEGRDLPELSLTEYEESLEQRLSELLCQISGAGRVKVMLTLDGGEETIYAADSTQTESNDSQENNHSSNTNFTSEYIIIKSGSSLEGGMPIVRLLPQVRGVAVVCDGAGDPSVALAVTSSVAAACGISTARISVSRMTDTTNGG